MLRTRVAAAVRVQRVMMMMHAPWLCTQQLLLGQIYWDVLQVRHSLSLSLSLAILYTLYNVQ